MNCRDIIELLAGFMDGEVSEGDKREIQEHLDSCEDCGKELEMLNKSWELLDNYSAPKVDARFTAAVMRKIRLETEDAREEKKVISLWDIFTRNRLQISGLAACLALAITFGIIINDPEITAVSPDDEIIKNLDIYENLELLEDLEVLSDLDVLETMGDDQA